MNSAFTGISCSCLFVLDRHVFHFPFCLGRRLGASDCLFFAAVIRIKHETRFLQVNF